MQLQNLSSENNFKGVQKPSHKNYLQLNVACVGMLTWKSYMKVQGPNLVCNILGKMGGRHLIKDVKQKDLNWC